MPNDINQITASPYTQSDKLIIKRFLEQEIGFYHADNLAHFVAYNKERKLLTREELRNNHSNLFTQFESDEEDLRQGASSRIFGNIYDHGQIFAGARDEANPNIYGPITLVFQPQVYPSLRDIVLTKRSLFYLRDNWRRNAVTQATQLEQILQDNEYNDKIAKSWRAAEISSAKCVVSLEQNLKQIIVEPITLNGISLIDTVKLVTNKYGITAPVVGRSYSYPQKISLINELAKVSDAYDRSVAIPSPTQWSMSTEQLPATVSTWDPRRKENLLRWCRHFTFGSLRLLRMLVPHS